MNEIECNKRKINKLCNYFCLFFVNDLPSGCIQDCHDFWYQFLFDFLVDQYCSGATGYLAVLEAHVSDADAVLILVYEYVCIIFEQEFQISAEDINQPGAILRYLANLDRFFGRIMHFCRVWYG